MNKTILYSLLLLLATALISCDPIESRDSIGDAITAEELDITATPIIVDGKKSNKVVLKNHSPVLSYWDCGITKTRNQSDTVILITPGQHNIHFTGYNPDGTTISKTLDVTVDEMVYPVPAEYGMLFGEGSKTWTWRSTASAWGMGGYLSDMGPMWWSVGVAELDDLLIKGEGKGTSFNFTVNGLGLTKKRNDGTEESGTFEISLDSKLTHANGGSYWSKGKINTSITLPCGILFHSDNKEVFEYHIIQVADDKLVLAAPEVGVGAGGVSWFWIFVPAE